MKFYLYNNGKKKALTKKELSKYLSDVQIREAIQDKTEDPLLEVSFCVGCGCFIIYE